VDINGQVDLPRIELKKGQAWMYWDTILEPISDSVHHYRFCDSDGNVMTFAEVIALWSSDASTGVDFRAFTTQTLCDSPFAAYRWETPVVDSARVNREFEFVILNSPGLNRPENQAPFAEKFASKASEELAITFSNVGREAVLVVPTPSGRSGVNHCHLASFLRTGDSNQVDRLWKQVGQAMLQRVSATPVWLSTTGGGVAWLHVRLDDRPKYYGHAPYRLG